MTSLPRVFTSGDVLARAAGTDVHLLTVETGGDRPQAGSGWQHKNHPDRLPANYHKLHGVRQFHGGYSVGEDTMFGVIHRQKIRG
jgi:hypothetical protein